MRIEHHLDHQQVLCELRHQPGLTAPRIGLASTASSPSEIDGSFGAGDLTEGGRSSSGCC
ncbi:MAG: hypothetical protein GY719_23705 [bacterium]|nr:hypothetical protein [bacterium]